MTTLYSQIAMTAPHAEAAIAGQKILENGGTAIEAMVAAAATISVVYPHMTGLGGDGFWLIHQPGKSPVAIDGSGYSANNLDCYQNLESVPARGGKACITIAGAVSGWQKALQWNEQNLTASHTLDELFGPAIMAAEQGFSVSESLAECTKEKYLELHRVHGFAETFLVNQNPLSAGNTFKQPKMANLLRLLTKNGLDDFYRGEVAKNISSALISAGSSLCFNDFNDFEAQFVSPLQVKLKGKTLFNLGAPTQGLASLLILAQFDELYDPNMNEIESMHLIVEATKNAFVIRDKFITDAQKLKQPLESFLTSESIKKLCDTIDMDKAQPWPKQALLGDTVWMGARDQNGVMVSYIQSLYWEFGSGVVIPEYGLVWNNRGISFSLDSEHHNSLEPRKKPLHTLNPALCIFDDDRRLAYGTMGGEGQPQTQAAIYHRIVNLQQTPEKAIAEPRWLLGRTWGDLSNNLKIEQSLFNRIGQDFHNIGHDVQCVPDLSEMMGHAGVIYERQDKVLAGTDPRSDGLAIVKDL